MFLSVSEGKAKPAKKRDPARKRAKKAASRKGPKMHHSVYVVLLDDAVARHPSVCKLNRGRDPRLPCVYVGMTGLPVEERFENHKAGYKSAWTVKKYGVRLMPELFAYLNPMPYDEAARMEKDLTADLRAQGYLVTGGT